MSTPNDKQLDTLLERLIERLKEEGKLSKGDQTVVFYGRTPEEGVMRLVGLKEIR